MSSDTQARAHVPTVASPAFLLFTGLILITGALLARNPSGPPAPQTSPLVRLMTQAVEPQAAPSKPSMFEAETAMSPRALMTRWDPQVAEASRRFKVPEKWLRAVMRMESGGRTMLKGDVPLISDAGALGIMQVMPGTYEEMRRQYGLGTDPFDPRDNIMAAAAYLRWLHAKYGFPAMFAAYNNGPGNLEAHLNQGRILPAETRFYIAGIAKILGTDAPSVMAKAKFTRPDGTAVWIETAKVSSLRAALPGEFGENVQAVLNLGTQRQAVCEDLDTAAALLRGGRNA